MMALASSLVQTPSNRGGLRTSVHFCFVLLAVCQSLSGTSTTASTTRHWSLAELSVTSSELPKQIPPPPYPVQQRIQSTPHYDQQLKLPSGNGVGSRNHYYPWTRPTVSMISADWCYYCPYNYYCFVNNFIATLSDHHFQNGNWTEMSRFHTDLLVISRAVLEEPHGGGEIFCIYLLFTYPIYFFP